METEGSAISPAAGTLGSILFADDDEPMRNSLGKYLVRAGFDCDFAASGEQVIERLRAKTYDVLLSDINMPGNENLELIEAISAANEGLPVIMLTGEPSVATAARSVRLHVAAYLTKPPEVAELCRLLREAAEDSRSRRLLRDNRRRIQDWDHEIERLQTLLQESPAADRQDAMRGYVRLTLRNMVVGLIELEHLLIHDGERLGTDAAVQTQELFHALRKTVGVLQRTKDHFKSKDLGELRKELEHLLG